MTRRTQWMMVIGIVAVAAIGVGASLLMFGDQIYRVTVGSRAPDFRAVTLDSVPVERSLADYRGRVVLLNLWATWCAPCIEEMPSLEALHREYEDRGLSVVAVSVDAAGSQEQIRRFARTYGLTFDILFDTLGATSRAYQQSKVPETFVIRRDGVISRKVYGKMDWASLANRSLIVQLLDEPVPGAGGRGTGARDARPG